MIPGDIVDIDNLKTIYILIVVKRFIIIYAKDEWHLCTSFVAKILCDSDVNGELSA